VNQLGNRLKPRQRFFHEGGAAPTEEAVERVAQVDCPPVPNDRSGHVRPSHCAARRLLKHILEREPHTQSLQVLDHFLRPPHPVGPAPLEEDFEGARVRRQEEPQHVHLAPGRCGRELTSADDSNAVALACGQSLGNAGQGIVIGEGDGPETGRDRPPHDCFRRKAPVRGGRMNMQVDRSSRAGRCVGGGQRRYPISGAVQDGCE
jgi:hypothetical protein